MTSSTVSNLQADLARQILAIAVEEQWSVGQRVSDFTLAKQLGVSRSPIRAALALLAGQGLLLHVPGKGYELARAPAGSEEIDNITPPSQVETLYRKLMADRASGALADEVSEAELTVRYDVTNGTLRKALLRFAAEGLIHRLRGHGWAFTESLVTDEVVTESYQFRLVVECGALRQPNFKIDQHEFLNIRAAQEAILQQPAGAVRRDQWFRINAQFHETLTSWSHNRFLVQAVRQQNNLRRMTEYADFERLSGTRIHDACIEHIAILDTLRSGDLEFAEALLRRHIERAGRDLTDDE